MNITLVSRERRHVVERLMQLYLYELSEYTEAELDSNGCYAYRYLPLYWQEETRYPLICELRGVVVGFALVRYEAPYYEMAEFFILRRYRRQQVGRRFATMVFQTFPGSWRICQLVRNTPAQAFWRNIIPKYEEYREVEQVCQTFMIGE